MAAFDMSKATPAQRETIEEIHKDRSIAAGQAVSPLWSSMIASAGATRRIAKLGAHCRFDSALSEAHREIAILGAVHPIGFAMEIKVHEEIATRLGFPASVLAAIREGRFDAVPQDIRSIAQLTNAVASGKGDTAAPLAAVRAQLGEQAAVDAVTTAGYYVMLYRVSQALKG